MTMSHVAIHSLFESSVKRNRVCNALGVTLCCSLMKLCYTCSIDIITHCTVNVV